MSAHPATQAKARPHATLAFVAGACVLLLLVALLRAFARLPAGYRRLLARGDDLPPSFLAALAPDAPAHTTHIALGLLRGWIMRCFPNLGMHPTPVLRPQTPRPPPDPRPTTTAQRRLPPTPPKNRPQARASSHALIIPLS